QWAWQNGPGRMRRTDYLRHRRFSAAGVWCATGLAGAEFVQAGSPAFRDIAITNREADREGVKVARCRPEQGAAMVSAELIPTNGMHLSTVSSPSASRPACSQCGYFCPLRGERDPVSGRRFECGLRLSAGPGRALIRSTVDVRTTFGWCPCIH